MQIYGKMAATAVSALSYLAMRYEGGSHRIASIDICREREISRALLGKILTTLSKAGLICGSPGPNGGYALSRSPGEITLYEIISEFERMDSPISCPFGPNWCGRHAPCPLHDQLAELHNRSQTFLKTTRLDTFCESGNEEMGRGI